MKTKVHEYEYSTKHETISSVTQRGRVPEDWHDGHVICAQGFVEVYAQGGVGVGKLSTLRFYRDGRCHVRTYDGIRYTPRGLVTKARQFARECTQKANRKPKSK